MEQSDTERIEYLLKTIEMILEDAEREANPEGGYVDFETGNFATEELRQLIKDAL